MVGPGAAILRDADAEAADGGIGDGRDPRTVVGATWRGARRFLLSAGSVAAVLVLAAAVGAFVTIAVGAGSKWTPHEFGYAAIGLLHPPSGSGVDKYVGVDCCDRINRQFDPDDIAGAQVVYGPPFGDTAGDGAPISRTAPGPGPTISWTPTPTASATCATGDFDADGFCAISDFNAFLVDFMTGTDGGAGTDLDGDGFVAISDFNRFRPGFIAGIPGPSAL